MTRLTACLCFLLVILASDFRSSLCAGDWFLLFGSQVQTGSIPDVERELMEPSAQKSQAVSETLREKAQRTFALQAGACGGAAWEAQRLSDELDAHANRMDRAFNFGPLIMAGNVLPPVITQARGVTRSSSSHELTTAWVSYRIVRDAEIVPVPPTWRGYLAISTPPCQQVPPSYMPKTAEEREKWRQAVKQGWDDGVEAAAAAMRAKLAELVRDLTGMMLFNELARQGLVGMPVVAAGPPHIVVQGKLLNVGEQEFRLTRDAIFRASNWKPVIVEDWAKRWASSGMRQ